GADGQGCVGRAGCGDGGGSVVAVVAGGDDEQAVRGGRELVDGKGERAAAVVGVAAEAHAHHVGTLVDGPDHAGQDPRVLTRTAVGEDLADHQAGPRGDALAEPAGRGTGPADRGGDVGAVAVAV